MTTTITINDMRRNGTLFLSSWETEKKEIKLSVKSMYALLKLKKSFETELDKMNEFIELTFERLGAVRNENGQLQLSEDKADEANAELSKFSETEIEFEYTPIQVRGEEDYIPPLIFEGIFDYVDLID